MRHEKFGLEAAELNRIAIADAKRPSRLSGFLLRSGRRIVGAFIKDRPDLRDFSDSQLRDIGLTRNDIERF